MLVRYEKHKIETRYGGWSPPYSKSIMKVTHASIGSTISGYSSYKFDIGKFSFDGCEPAVYTARAEGQSWGGAYTSYVNGGNNPYVVYESFSGEAELNNICINTYYCYAHRSISEECGELLEIITVEDGAYPEDGKQGDYWWIKKGLANVPPIISGQDSNIGSKYSPFSIKYIICDNDDINFTVQENLDGINLKTFTANKDVEYSCTIPDNTFYALPDGQHTIKIEVVDGVGNKATRIYTFNKLYIPLVISGKDEGLGVKDSAFGVKYIISCDNPEVSTFTVEERLDDLILRKYDAVKNIEYTFAVQDSNFYKLENGQHTATIKVTDKGKTVIRQYTFSKQEKSIELQLSKIIDADRQPKTILLMPEWQGIENNTIKAEVCNDAYDLAPVWEDATESIKTGKEYTFSNKAKTADKWGINVRFTCNKIKTDSTILLKGFKAEINM